MDFRSINRLLGIVAILIGVSMIFSLPWAFPAVGYRASVVADVGGGSLPNARFETAGFFSLLASMVVCGLTGAALLRFGRTTQRRIYRKEAMAAVGLSWVLATILGALPFYFAGTYRCAAVRMQGPDQMPIIFEFGSWNPRTQWRRSPRLTPDQHRLIHALHAAGAVGLSPQQLHKSVLGQRAETTLRDLLASNSVWRTIIMLPQAPYGPVTFSNNYRIRWVHMSLIDAFFEAQSGFSTTGATVIADLENPILVPHCILFWRSTTHFLGGLGIILLFVSLLGGGAGGKALMRAEMPGPTKEGMTPRIQQTAWLFVAVYVGLNAVLAVILHVAGLTVFDSLCHAFGTMATGGFSTYNSSVGHFANHPDKYNSELVEYSITLFMILAGTNFTLLYLCVIRQPRKLVNDPEWRAYIGIIVLATGLVMLFGLLHADFPNLRGALRHGLFQVVSIITTTGFGTHDFDQWNHFGRAVLFILMFIGGCAGSTAGGMKVIRHVLLAKILRQEIELAGHPRVVRPLRLGGQVVSDPNLRKNILTYSCLIVVVFVVGWMFVIGFESEVIWGQGIEHKLIDCASGVAATLNNIGPGLGIVGATQQYTAFSPVTKLLFVALMMLGRLELFSILVLFSPRFWCAL